MKMTRVFAATMTAAIFAGQSVLAGQCGYAYCWGAVAIGPNGAWGYSHSHYSEQNATHALQTECEWDCDNVHTFYNTCGAIAKAHAGNWGFGKGSTRQSAEYSALAYCSQYGDGCEVKVWSCSP
ncbi:MULTISPECIES: DUF4189 domain-containing protein [unclassified Shimia]|uniref:DUF4189 domain-containing protein n=1 Tax=unclassified Shimia TaxID=2630038 RepID=UPI003109CACE